MTITFIGHGYVGLVTATVFAELGNTVWVIGHTPEKVENLKKGILPIYEPGLEEVVKRNVEAGRLLFTLDYKPAITESKIVFIAVGTPPQSDGSADLSVVFETAKKIGENLGEYAVVSVKSTVPVGTNHKVKELINEVKPEGATFDIASVPEFLREGQALGDTQYPDRVVIGTETEKARDLMVELHGPIIHNTQKDTHLVTTNVQTAEMIKYAANGFLATKISFANAIAQLSEKTGSDGVAVLEAIGLDKRIGKAFLNAGAGYGGSCFPKDVKALIKIAEKHGYDFKLLKDVEEINRTAMEDISRKAKEMLTDVSGKTIAVLGLAFKPDTDDIRDAPAKVIINSLLESGAKIVAYDPIAQENMQGVYNEKEGITFASNAYNAVEGADLAIVVTDWDEFKELDLSKVKSVMNEAKLIDARNIYEPEKIKALGFTYLGVGRS